MLPRGPDGSAAAGADSLQKLVLIDRFGAAASPASVY